jgi:hypothetical protein
VANTLNLLRNGAVGFIDWLDVNGGMRDDAILSSDYFSACPKYYEIRNQCDLCEIPLPSCAFFSARNHV